MKFTFYPQFNRYTATEKARIKTFLNNYNLMDQIKDKTITFDQLFDALVSEVLKNDNGNSGVSYQPVIQFLLHLDEEQFYRKLIEIFKTVGESIICFPFFQDNTFIKTVDMKGVTFIPACCFDGSLIQSAKLPGVTFVDYKAFGYCERLTELVDPDVREQDSDAYEGCVNLPEPDWISKI